MKKKFLLDNNKYYLFIYFHKKNIYIIYLIFF